MYEFFVFLVYCVAVNFGVGLGNIQIKKTGITNVKTTIIQCTY